MYMKAIFNQSKKDTASNPACLSIPKKITLADLQANPDGLTLLNQTAQLFNRHPMTIRRWLKTDWFVTPIKINGMYYFKNRELLNFIEILPVLEGDN